MAERGVEQRGNQELAEMRRRIVEAAAVLYEKKGRTASVEEIAGEAGISVPVTYQFVKKPADIMLLIMERVQSRFRAGTQARLDQSAPAETRLREAMAQYYRVVDEEMPAVMLVYRESLTLDKAGRRRIMQLELEAVEVFRSILEQGVAAGEFKTMDTDLAAYDIVVAGHSWALKAWHFKKRGLDFEQFLARQQALFTAMARG